MLTSLASSSRGMESAAAGPPTSKVLRPTLDLALRLTRDHRPGAESMNKPRDAKYEGLMSSAKLPCASKNRGAIVAIRGVDNNEMDDEVVSESSAKNPMPRGVLSPTKFSVKRDESFLPPSAVTVTATPRRRRTVRVLDATCGAREAHVAGLEVTRDATGVAGAQRAIDEVLIINSVDVAYPRGLKKRTRDGSLRRGTE
mmetsp:Transcript_4917/g.18250  ORF Transcript_4917/g.18250 Transcript_4917/m.18250 type:complete len:199 (+) Transcript_4917:526-1122(+)